MDLADLKPQGDTSEKADWPLDAATNKRLRLLQLPMTNMIQTVFIRDQTILPFHRPN
jgi:hypothetical protein